MRKVAIITGCAKGIGREIALELARDGYNIIGTYLTSKSEIENLKNRIELIGVKFDYYKLDLSEESEIKKFCDIMKSKYKFIDVLVNNAAYVSDAPFLEKTSKEFLKVLKVNLLAPFLVVQNLYDIILGGTIINISSTDGINTYSKLSMDYSASKAGLINLTKSLSLELENTKVYAICPNWVDTESIKEMNPDYLKEEMDRIGQRKLIDPKAVAKKVIQLIESDASSGSIIVMEDKCE